MTEVAAFDRLAARYDELWTDTAAGRLQREAVWREIAPFFRGGENVLDLGCGTGEDALYLERQGVRVRAFDASPGMVAVARARGVDARVLRLENLDQIEGTFDGALSNFGALNCVADLYGLRDPLARLIRPGGFLAVCVIGRFCLWETAYFLARGEFRKAVRRWSGSSVCASLGLRVYYPAVAEIRSAFEPDFRLVRTAGIGAIDRRVGHWPGLRALADHRLLVFRRC